MSGQMRRSAGTEVRVNAGGPIFKNADERIPWEVFWARLAEYHGMSLPEFTDRHGHLFPLLRYLIQCEGTSSALNQPVDYISSSELGAFTVYFPLEHMMDDINWLNDHKYFMLGSHTNMLQSVMKTQEPSVYYGGGETLSGAQPGDRVYRNGDFLVRPSKRMPGKLVVSILNSGQLKHSVIYQRLEKPCPLMIDGFQFKKPNMRIRGLKDLVECLIKINDGDFKQGCGVIVTKDTDVAGMQTRSPEPEDPLEELNGLIKDLKLSVADVKNWTQSDQEELLKSTLQLDVVRRNRMMAAMKKLSQVDSPTASATASHDATCWDGRIPVPHPPAAPIHGGFIIRCIDRQGVAYRSAPEMATIISPDNGISYGTTVEVVSTEGTFFKTCNGTFLPREISGEPCFEIVSSGLSADSDHRPLGQSVKRTGTKVLEIQGASGSRLKIQIAYSNILGSGSFAKVYEAMDCSTGEQRALKELVLGAENSDAELQRVLREMKLMASLRHRNIVQFYGSHLDGTHLHLCMELMHQTLQQIINQYGVVPELITKRYGLQIVSGLKYLHDNKVVHRDLKPSNILVDHTGTAKLSDFGCSKQVATGTHDTGATQTGRLVGTPMYMAPEVIHAFVNSDSGTSTPLKQPEQADIWSLGCTLLEMATGNKPWPESNGMRLILTISANEDLLPDIPRDLHPDLLHLLSATISRNPNDRLSIAGVSTHPYFADLVASD